MPAEDAAWQELDPAQRRQRTLDAVKALLLRESQGQPLLLVFEDLHWMDTETQALLDGLVESLPRARIAPARQLPARVPPRLGRQDVLHAARAWTRSRPKARRSCSGAARGRARPRALKQLLIARTEGNPFFLEESVRTLVETGALDGGAGRVPRGRPLATIQMPATVQSILAARIDRLPEREKRLLQSASVIGKDVPYALLLALEDAPEEELRGRWPISRPPSSCTRRASSLTSSTRSSTR